MTSGNPPASRIDLKGSLDRLAPPSAILASPVPVAIVADVSTFSSELFEPRAIVNVEDTFFRGAAAVPGGRFGMQPIAGGGLVIEAFNWDLSLSAGNFTGWGFRVDQVAQVALGADTTFIQVVDIGGDQVNIFAAKGGAQTAFSVFQQTTGSDSLSNLFTNDTRIFVPAGGQFLCGLDDTFAVPGDLNVEYELAIRTIPTVPKAGV